MSEKLGGFLRRRGVSLLRVAAAAGATLAVSFGDPVELHLVTGAVLQQRLEAGEVAAAQRQETIQSLFEQEGCNVQLQRIDRRAANVICDLAGETKATVIVGGHLDFAERGEGIVDDWSGTALLVSLYQTLKTERLKHTYRFVAFNEEERGLIGSKFYVQEMNKEERARTQAFVNLECLGLTEPKVWVSRSTPALVDQLASVAQALKIPLAGVNVGRVGDDDTHPFLLDKIPVISVHSLTAETWPVLHSPRDKISAIKAGDYYDAYRLAAFYLKYLDAKLPE